MIIFNSLSYFFFIISHGILFSQWWIFSIFNITYLIEEIKYLLELKKNVIHRTKLSLATELHFLVNANKYLVRSPETQGLVESNQFSLTLPNLLRVWLHSTSQKFRNF